MKHCMRCSEELPLTSFHKDKRRRDGLYPWCKDCRRTYVGAQPFKPAQMSKPDYDRARRAVLKLAPNYDDEWRRKYLWSSFRMEPEDYDNRLTEQGGRCAICGTDDPGRGRGREVKRFAVDHDHACCPGKKSCGRCIRGLLCLQCNTGLGSFADDMDRLARAMEYLSRRAAGQGIA